MNKCKTETETDTKTDTETQTKTIRCTLPQIHKLTVIDINPKYT